MRATDRGRARAVGQLRAAYLSGALSTDTFEARAAAVYGSRTIHEVAGAVEDLPTAWERARCLAVELAALVRSSPGPPLGEEAREVELPRKAGARIFIGRHRHCDVVIDDPAVSRWHLEISYDGEAWEARDLASTNGTFVWNRRISAAEARPGDVLRVGASALRLN